VSDAALVVALKDEVDSSARRLAMMATNLVTTLTGGEPGRAIRVDADVTRIYFDGHSQTVADFLKACIAHSHLRARYGAAIAALPTEPR